MCARKNPKQIMRSVVHRFGVCYYYYYCLVFLPFPRGALAFHTTTTTTTTTETTALSTPLPVSRCSNRPMSVSVSLSASSSSSSDISIKNSNNNNNNNALKILALHGSEGSAESFHSQLERLVTTLKEDYNVAPLDVTCLQAPFPKGGGYAWWKMSPGARSFTATEYQGFDISSRQVLEAWKGNNENDNDSRPFDLILGHSQGAIMISALLALDLVPYHPKRGYILNGVAFPNPYSNQMKSLKKVGVSNTTKNDDDDNNGTDSDSDNASDIPRVLFIMGVNDKINPISTGSQVRDAFQKAGMSVSTIQHPGGHSIPIRNKDDDDTMTNIIHWILQK